MSQEMVLIGFYLITLVYSIIIHEVSHGVMALWLGDKTAQYAGRLNMNPRWVKPGDPSWSVIREQYDKQKQDLHMRRCQKCVDELVAQVTKHWPQKASRAAG
jgi:hypothetical protein